MKGVRQTEHGGELWWRPYAHYRAKRIEERKRLVTKNKNNRKADCG